MRVFIIVVLFFLSFAAPAFAAEKENRKILYWYDPMVPGQKFDKPGKSPYMDMDLVPFYAQPSSAQAKPDKGAIHINARTRQALGVKTGTASLHDFGSVFRAEGEIIPDTRLQYNVTVRTAGWITGLDADAVGDRVKKGDRLFTYYSPKLMQAQADFMVGRDRGDNEAQRLHLYGMDDKAIAELKRQAGRFLEKTPFYAAADGTISVLNARPGAYLPEGSTVLILQNYAQIWVNAAVPLQALQFLKPGTPATVTINSTNETLKTAIDIIYPQADPQSRDGHVRLVLDNPDGVLKPGTLVEIAFTADPQPRLAVPAQSVLYDKRGGHVLLVQGGGYFKPVPVITGIMADGFTEILSGLDAGQEIVTSGQFMIDSESNLESAMQAMGAGHE